MNLQEFIQGIYFKDIQPMDDKGYGHNPPLEFANTFFPGEEDTIIKSKLNLFYPHYPKYSTLASAGVVNKAVQLMPENQVYLNIGVLFGYSLFAGALGNPTKTCIGVDNFSDPIVGLKQTFSGFWKVMMVFNQKTKFHEVDYVYYLANIHREKLGVYFYDAEHSRENQYKALIMAEPFFAPGCVILIDDTNGHEPREANEQFMNEREGQYELLFDFRTFGNGHPTWWNGFYGFSKKGVTMLVEDMGINVVQDLNEFMGTNDAPEEIEQKVHHYNSLLDGELEKAYQKANGNKPEAMKYFYEERESVGLFYLYALAVWEGLRLDRPVFTNHMIKFSNKYGVRKIFDFGMGIGSDALYLAKAGFEVSGCEIDNIHTDFLKWRIKKHGVDIKVFSEFPDEQVDLVILLAVIEHIWEPVKLLTHLAHYTKFFTWIFDLHNDGTDKGKHCVEFYKELDPFTYAGFVSCNGVEYTRRFPGAVDHGRPSFYEVKVL